MGPITLIVCVAIGIALAPVILPLLAFSILAIGGVGLLYGTLLIALWWITIPATAIFILLRYWTPTSPSYSLAKQLVAVVFVVALAVVVMGSVDGKAFAHFHRWGHYILFAALGAQ